MKILGVIPARYGSTRFPGKPLALIDGKPMIIHVVERARSCPDLDEVVVATDHDEIAAVVRAMGGNVVMTRSDHPSGTDRCLEALSLWSGDWEAIINIQGDEPFIAPDAISEVASLLRTDAGIATLKKTLPSDEATNPNRVKVVCDADGFALYFSRSPIPYARNGEADYFLHVGLYGYTRSALVRITSYPPSTLETTESLEQLRWLENGEKIRVGLTKYEAVSVDTPEDLAALGR